MTCRKAQRLIEDLERDRLTEPVASRVRQHLEDCTDCRVQQQRTARLRRLLALKRHEQPTEPYWESFLGEFHHRLAAEMRPQPAFWIRWADRLADWLGFTPSRAWHYGFACALGSACVVGLAWLRLLDYGPSPEERQAARPTVAVMAGAALPAPQSMPERIAAPLPTVAPEAPEPSPAATGILVVPAAVQTGPTRPGYVLDRIAVTPASYEVAARINF